MTVIDMAEFIFRILLSGPVLKSLVFRKSNSLTWAADRLAHGRQVKEVLFVVDLAERTLPGLTSPAPLGLSQ